MLAGGRGHCYVEFADSPLALAKVIISAYCVQRDCLAELTCGSLHTEMVTCGLICSWSWDVSAGSISDNEFSHWIFYANELYMDGTDG